MKDLKTLEYHKTSEELVQVLCKKTQSDNPLFFRVMVAYYFSKVASMMRANIKTKDRGKLPINMYALNLALSGAGKGHSTYIVEEQVIQQFKERFVEETFPAVSDKNLATLAVKRAAKKAADPDDELERVKKEFENLGAMVFSFDSGTAPAVKQMRHKLLMADAGSMNLEIDEIGSNLVGQTEVLNTFLELYDQGRIKQKLTKNTNDSVRGEEIDGKTPTNMLLFGTPTKLLNGGKTEDEFYSMLETGYARRCFFGYSKNTSKDTKLTPEEVYDMLTDTSTDTFLEQLSEQLGKLADSVHFGKNILVSKEVSILFIEYKMYCERLASEIPEHDEIRKAEVSHRYFKAMKLAGTYAFIDNTHEITEDQAYNAIKLAEESGEAFGGILTRDRNYVKLANYIANVGREVTHVDLVEDLPFYKGSEAQKRELMTLAIAYGYKNNIIIKKSLNDGIEFLKGESLQKTDLDKTIVSYSTDFAKDYLNEHVKYEDLHKLTQLAGYHWVAHHLVGGYRSEDKAIPGFNLVVIDVDKDVDMSTAQLLLKDYKCMFYTTKRHQKVEDGIKNGDRFRIVFPINYTLKMDAREYKEFMENIYEWLPFEVDKQTNQRSRKWMSHNGQYSYNDGDLLDALLFIPKTTKNEETKRVINDLQSLTNIERWFVKGMQVGGRNNQMIKYALLLVDSGFNFNDIQHKVLSLNSRLDNKLEESEILSTVMTTVGKALTKRT